MKNRFYGFIKSSSKLLDTPYKKTEEEERIFSIILNTLKDKNNTQILISTEVNQRISIVNEIQNFCMIFDVHNSKITMKNSVNDIFDIKIKRSFKTQLLNLIKIEREARFNFCVNNIEYLLKEKLKNTSNFFSEPVENLLTS